MATDIQPQVMVIFSKKTGKIKDKGIIMGRSNAMMRGYIFQNGLKKTEDAIIFGLEDGIVKYSFEGNGDFPKQTKGNYHEEEAIEEICEGLLEECRKMWDERDE